MLRFSTLPDDVQPRNEVSIERSYGVELFGWSTLSMTCLRGSNVRKSMTVIRACNRKATVQRTPNDH